MSRSVSIVLLVLLVACGRASAAPLTAQSVIDTFESAGLHVTDVAPDPPNPDSPRPNSFKEQLGFTIPALGDKGGQVFVCDTKQNCDALYQYYAMISSLGGPYYYQSPNGLVVAQLNSGLDAATAAKFEQVVNSFK